MLTLLVPVQNMKNKINHMELLKTIFFKTSKYDLKFKHLIFNKTHFQKIRSKQTWIGINNLENIHRMYYYFLESGFHVIIVTSLF